MASETIDIVVEDMNMNGSEMDTVDEVLRDAVGSTTEMPAYVLGVPSIRAEIESRLRSDFEVEFSDECVTIRKRTEGVLLDDLLEEGEICMPEEFESF